jgi:hypothetical protein
MDIKEQAHKYLIEKGCLSVGQTYTAVQVERMLTEFAQNQVKLFCQPAVINSLREHEKCRLCGEPTEQSGDV